MTDVAGPTKTEAFHFRARQPSLILAIRQMYDLSEDTELMLLIPLSHSVAELHYADVSMRGVSRWDEYEDGFTW